MPNTVIVGAQWGDEGKGKIIDVLTADVDVVVRYQGGSNAGHTVKVGDLKYVLHLVPSGILHPGKLCVIGNGVVIDPMALITEIDELAEKGIDVTGRLFVSDRAHIVVPYHKEIDAAREGRANATKIGTTKRGIGPAYGDKAARVGLRLCDMMDPCFIQMLQARIEESNKVITSLGGNAVDKASVLDTYAKAAERLRPFVVDTVFMLNQLSKEGRTILFEGAQGTMLDIDFGTYPFVTSSNATTGGAATGTGLSPRVIDRVVGVVKAYTTRVGEGPFMTELTDDIGKLLGKEGNEFGATTGRPRRCGWFDAVVARYAAAVNGIDLWSITKLDVLDTLKTIRICVAYECDGRRYETVPANIRILERCKPIYEDWDGWQSRTSDITRWEDLPLKAQLYVNRLCELTGVKLGILSVGPKRESTLRINL
jgi:adenylosuccinate synthase